MTPGTLEFEGTRYLDGSASDPNVLGWMQGAPPPAAKRIRFEDDKFLKFPEIRWTLSHMRELLPTVPVWRGTGACSDLGVYAAQRGRPSTRCRSMICMGGGSPGRNPC
jgi:hypothetical protein